MEVEQLIGLGVVILLALLSAWLVWSCMCKGGQDDDDEDDVESHDDEVKSVNSRTRVISTSDIEHNLYTKDVDEVTGTGAEFHPRQIFTKGKGKNKPSCYVQSSVNGRGASSFADPFGEWTRREKEIDDTEALSGVKSYRKSPLLSRSSRS